MIPNEAEGPVREDAGADVKKAGVTGAKAESALREAMLGHMAVCGGENRVFHGAKGPFG